MVLSRTGELICSGELVVCLSHREWSFPPWSFPTVICLSNARDMRSTEAPPQALSRRAPPPPPA